MESLRIDMISSAKWGYIDRAFGCIIWFGGLYVILGSIEVNDDDGINGARGPLAFLFVCAQR